LFRRLFKRFGNLKERHTSKYIQHEQTPVVDLDNLDKQLVLSDAHMFDKLRKAFSSATKSIGQRDLSEKDVDNSLRNLQLGLLESDVAQEVISLQN
jgi:signal recognition particle GTPase